MQLHFGGFGETECGPPSGRLVPKGQQDSVQGFNQVLTLGIRTMMRNAPWKGGRLELRLLFNLTWVRLGLILCCALSGRVDLWDAHSQG
jgi:hypothetical protein